MLARNKERQYQNYIDHYIISHTGDICEVNKCYLRDSNKIFNKHLKKKHSSTLHLWRFCQWPAIDTSAGPSHISWIWNPIDIVIICIYYFVNTRCAETEIFRNNYAEPITADALAPCVTRPTETIALTAQNKAVLSSTTKDFSYLHLRNVEMQIFIYVSKRNLARHVMKNAPFCPVSWWRHLM